ncbi:hypothetical protein [Kallotenue papyrolyticum]|uniref:hypothetical protein n=1 Tax=Kallotenue papyrolyticum TaxID=1325125 RepID=UPI0004785E1A|nr:hypothetical protein [Kallotenue papyrolyticum]
MPQTEQLIERCLTDLGTHLAHSTVPTPYGRDAVINDLLQMLAANLERYPLLLGRPGVGKTLTMYAIAERVRRGAAPEPLQGLRIWETSPARLSLLVGEDGDSEPLGQLWESINRTPGLLLLRNLDEIAKHT